MAINDPRGAGSRGLGDFQRRLNRDHDMDRNWKGKGNEAAARGNVWDTTPRTDREFQGPASSVRVPNVGWESTPRQNRGDDGSWWGAAKNRTWDAPTPRVARGGSPDDGEGALGIDVREWEEEQVKLDRDWYTGAEEGVLAGDEEHNPLAQYEDLNRLKQAEMAAKQVVGKVHVDLAFA
jgi:pre-mRNA-splicing factor ATP-dependent RNA helicase DHX38/PRP16